MGGKKHTCRVASLAAGRKLCTSIEQVFTSKQFETKHRIPAYRRAVKTFKVLNWFSFFLGLVPFIPCKRPEYLRSIFLAGKKNRWKDVLHHKTLFFLIFLISTLLLAVQYKVLYLFFLSFFQFKKAGIFGGITETFQMPAIK